MGKVVRATAATDSSEEERRKTVRKEEKVRTKKKKCKRDLRELQRKLLKSKRNKETQIDGKSGKAGNSKKTATRILPRLVGIYRNGAAGKTIRRSEAKESLNDINNARLQGDVYKLLNGCGSESETIIVENDTKKILKDPLLDSNIKNILQPTPLGDEYLSPVLGKVDGKKRCPRKEPTENLNPLTVFDFPQQHSEKNNEQSDDFAMKKYEELCNTISAENFEGRNFPETTTDPLTATKKKLRSMFAESFRSQCLRDMIKRGTVLNETATSSTKSVLQPEYRSSGYAQRADLASVAVENPECQLHRRKDSLPESQNIFILPERFDVDGRKSEVPTSHLLFDLSLFNASNTEAENVELSRGNPADASSNSPTFPRISRFDNPRCKEDSGITYFEAAASHANKMEKNESPLFIPMEAQLPNDFVSKKHLLKHKNRVQRMHQAKHVTRHPGKGNLKAPQAKLKNLKHVPAILRRCNTATNSNEVNLFDQSMHNNKKLQDPASNVLFTSQTELNTNAKKLETSAMFDPADMKTCVMASPSLRKDEVRFKPQTNEMYFSKRNAPIQKTIMFTKKDSRNISDCLHVNSLITTDNPNVCVMKRSVSENACSAHRNCQRASMNYHRCSEGSDGSYYCSQESNASQIQNAEVHQKPVVCEKLLLRRVPHHGQKCPNDEHVCYVVVDSKNQERSSDSVSCHKEKLRTVHGRNFCQEDVPDIGILKGVQNLQILPMEEQEQTNFTNGQCRRNAVVLEEQPVKYLAVENNNRTQKIPIYVQSNRVATADNVEVIDSGVNYRVVSCAQEPARNVIFVPACEQSKVVYGKQEKLASSFEEPPQARKVILYRPEFQSNVWCVKDPPNACKVHVPKQKMVEIRNAERDEIVRNLQGDKVKLTRRGAVNWDDLHYRSNHEYQHTNDGCVRKHAIFYQK